MVSASYARAYDSTKILRDINRKSNTKVCELRPFHGHAIESLPNWMPQYASSHGVCLKVTIFRCLPSAPFAHSS